MKNSIFVVPLRKLLGFRCLVLMEWRECWVHCGHVSIIQQLYNNVFQWLTLQGYRCISSLSGSAHSSSVPSTPHLNRHNAPPPTPSPFHIPLCPGQQASSNCLHHTGENSFLERQALLPLPLSEPAWLLPLPAGWEKPELNIGPGTDWLKLVK